MMRALPLMMAGVAVLALTAPVVAPARPWLVWNTSASVPLGLYAVVSGNTFELSTLVAVMPPEPLRAFLVERGYLGAGAPLLKRVAALPGQSVCRNGRQIMVDRAPVAEARARDSRNHPLPVWQGCRIIADGELFLLNADVPDSLDGRYFGSVPVTAVIGRAVPLFTWGRDANRSPEAVPPHASRMARHLANPD